jgi:uncharacterized Zn finger protein (UPF0148 family)
MDLKCPKCGSVIYSRRNVLCGSCGERLPEELLFNAEQRAAVEKDLAELKERTEREKCNSADSPSNILMRRVDGI